MAWAWDEEWHIDQVRKMDSVAVSLFVEILEWEENGERELAVDVGRDESGLYIEVNGHEISMDEETLQAAVLYAVKEELDFV